MYQTNRELSLQNAVSVAQSGLSAISQGETEFDLSALVVVDSAAVAVMLDWQRAASLKNKTIHFKSIPSNLLSLIALYGMSELLSTNPSQVERH
ncbi:STAS domain-containing protein [Undibacterium sp. RTI2.1]|uniref:STAS domain-containing protein n=1 Tax=unclassified Undibacterium TaxID=2630295 RepID=UPI002AB40826|nr:MULTISPECIES: STAS domain-containing protein [unclassified Undibacterium]MDY7540179.1 STAS domain-containing protein [Undibacterium sp. 5I1]MEB0030353.1 STAS domain-containing protein [Undibacterium sp. RTI2.1]MEB0115366.1 STAS domain-containing protein [Undibacterium sp. RTI2.2]MEB0230574.1 STAS domain-containing protein [Undibacterium sp. 10I3]MEB0257106.1 STAS domain-containing protein [Undibacterium sp. 5I1]